MRHEFKQNKFLPAKKQIVIADPDVTVIELYDDDEFLVIAVDSGTCKECYKEANEIEEELERDIEELKAKVAFLKL